MTRKEIIDHIIEKGSYLCVGLDSERQKLPLHLRDHPDGVFLFNKAIIDATQTHCVAYKINTAFYEAEGIKGWDALERTVNYIPSTHFKIADAKRGDIGNTSAQYAKAFFETLHFDAITVAPYMGEDSLRPFLEFDNKWTIVLGLTSNAGARDFELQKVTTSDGSPEYLYEHVLKKVTRWGTVDNLMFVIGATQSEEFTRIREIIPDHFLLVPGVGAQGGSLQEISEGTLINDCGLLVNASRAIIFASSGEDFADQAKQAAEAYQREMKIYLLKGSQH